LTQAQINAAAVASSLDQAHMTLTQRFTAEAQAVKLLRNAYMEANAASLNFSIGKGIAKTPGMPLANGILSVPGPKGAGDVVPAMLSPGEAVIPAKQNKKFGGLIRGIIADKIPGFETGVDNLQNINFQGKEYKLGTRSKTAKQTVDKYLARYSKTEEGTQKLVSMLESLEQKALENNKMQNVTTKSIQKALDEVGLRKMYGKGESPQAQGRVFAHGIGQKNISPENMMRLKTFGGLIPDTDSPASTYKGIRQAERGTELSNFGFDLPSAANSGSMSPANMAKEFLDTKLQKQTMSPFYEEWAKDAGKTMNEVLSDPKLLKETLS
jgi:hypothetical protein